MRSDRTDKEENRTVLLTEGEESLNLPDDTGEEGSGLQEEEDERTIILDDGRAEMYQDREQTIFMDGASASGHSGRIGHQGTWQSRSVDSASQPGSRQSQSGSVGYQDSRQSQPGSVGYQGSWQSRSMDSASRNGSWQSQPGTGRQQEPSYGQPDPQDPWSRQPQGQPTGSSRVTEAGRDWAGQWISRCPNCMREIRPGAKFCPKCGFQMGTKPKEIYHLHPGMILSDRYMIGTVLGFGGFGITYRAWDYKLDVMVAIKEYYPAGIVNRIPGEKEVILYTGKSRKEFAIGLDRFLEEARNTAKFSDHPNIVNVFDFFEENGTAYIVMEFLDGISLKDYMKKQGGRLGWEEAVSITCAIIEALKRVHGTGILHRDISPDNIFLCTDGKTKLIDFGAARFSTGEEEKTLSIVLKMGYAPPEQYRSKSRQGPWTDIYALGATLYRVLTGKVPDESVNRAVEDTLAEPKALEPSIPEYLSRAVMKAMALQPEFRFQNVKDFQDAILNKTEVLTLKEDMKRRRRKRALGTAAIFLVILGAAGTAGFIYKNKREEAFLRRAEVSVWIPVREGREEEEEQEIFAEMALEFQKDYPQITFDPVYIPEEDYEKKLKRAVENGQLPVLFESSSLKDGLDGMTEPMDDVLKRIQPEDYYFLDQYEDYFPEKDRMPLGFEATVLYGNFTLLDDVSAFAAENEEAGFLEGKTAAYAGTTSEYHQIQDVLSGRYTVKAMPEKKTAGQFTNLWSIDASASKAEKRAAQRFLYYYLSERGQEILHVDNRGTLPLEKKQLEVYLDVNRELDFLKDHLGRIHMVSFGELPKEEEKIYEELYQDSGHTAEYLKETAEE